ncbi:MAG: hypothetical protein ACYTFY_17185 [Planctomycetota bacterium]|jgi:hypothetical protein
MDFTEGKIIWDISKISDRESSRFELTDIIRYKGLWYCTFREADTHHCVPGGRGRVLRSEDGVEWETCKVFSWDSADVREIHFSITPEGWLMANTSIYFVSKQPRGIDADKDKVYTPEEAASEKGRKTAYYQLDSPKHSGRCGESDGIMRQSIAWFTEDGTNWSSAYAPEAGANTWLWKVVWHNGMGYTVCKELGGRLYRTRDGKNWRILQDNFGPTHNLCNEADIAFGSDDTAYCLMRNAVYRKENLVDYVGDGLPMFGTGKAPYYTDWQWQELKFDWHNDGNLKNAKEFLKAPLGGPKLMYLKDGRLASVGRVYTPEQDNGHIVLFLVDEKDAVFKKIAEFNGSSYGGFYEYEGEIWVTFTDMKASAIHLAKVKVPD